MRKKLLFIHLDWTLKLFNHSTSLDSLKHWKATTEYHKTKDIVRVKRLLGHRRIGNTMRYTHLVNVDNPDQFTSRVAKTLEAAEELVEAGFEYVTDMEDSKLFRKRT